MNISIYDKTAKGRDEIATRGHQLAPRVRTLLLLVDGRRPEEELLRNVAGLGLTADALRQLVEQEFIVLSTSYVALAEQAAAVEVEPAPQPVPTQVPTPAKPGAPSTIPTASQIQQFQSLYDFYNKTIRSTMGLRGFTLQLKVEKAGSLDDLRELRGPYLEAVKKAKGTVTATTLAQQLDQLLGGGPAA